MSLVEAAALLRAVQRTVGTLATEAVSAALPADRGGAAVPETTPAAAPSWQPEAPLSTHPQGTDRAHWYLRTSWDEGLTPGMDVQLLPVRSLSLGERAETDAPSRDDASPAPTALIPRARPAEAAAGTDRSWSVMIKADGHVVSHAGILYRVVQVGEQRVAVGGVGPVTTLLPWRGRGYARAVLRKAAAFVGDVLAAPFALALCPEEAVAFYRGLGWQVVDAPVNCVDASVDVGGRVSRCSAVAVVLPCQQRPWPAGAIDLRGLPW